MKSCGIVVEYNPFHNGHKYHLEQSKQSAGADCMIAIMSGNFLQRGEPAIIDKWHRTEAALQTGVDLVLELPYIYAVEHSDYFSQGAVQSLAEIGVESICFGSESGSIDDFLHAHQVVDTHQDTYHETVRKNLHTGASYPEASRLGYEAIGLATGNIDLSQPNNILGYSYVKQMLAYDDQITPLTIQRKNNHYHDTEIKGTVASATSIRKQLLSDQDMTPQIRKSLPLATEEQLMKYKTTTGLWHEWEAYFSLLQYKILTLRESDLRAIHGIDEGLEHRLKRTIRGAVNFQEFMKKLKTKRYTWNRLQRALVHILTGTTKQEARLLLDADTPPYVRVLGMTGKGREYLNKQKKKMDIPCITQPQKLDHPMIELEEKAMISYYSPLKAETRVKMMKKEYTAPLFV